MANEQAKLKIRSPLLRVRNNQSNINSDSYYFHTQPAVFKLNNGVSATLSLLLHSSNVVSQLSSSGNWWYRVNVLNVKWDINLIANFQLGVQKYGRVLPAVCRRGISLIVKAEHASMASSANSLGGFSFFLFLFFVFFNVFRFIINAMHIVRTLMNGDKIDNDGGVICNLRLNGWYAASFYWN